MTTRKVVALLQFSPKLVGLEFEINPYLAHHLLPELTALNLSLKKLDLTVKHQPRDQDLVPRTTEFLSSQSTSLTSLTLTQSIRHKYSIVRLRLPGLPALKTLDLKFPNNFRSSRPLDILTTGQFPALQKVSLTAFWEQFDAFDDFCTFPSVHELNLIQHRDPFYGVDWRYRFPNLTTLTMEILCYCKPVVEETVGYIFTHFTGLKNLDLILVGPQDFWVYGLLQASPDLWKAFTGGVPPRAILNVGQAIEARDEKPSDGVYCVASLLNMKSLKTFRFSPILRSNLDALVYMTNAGHFHLEKLTIVDNTENSLGMDIQEKSDYISALDEVHVNVEWIEDFRCPLEYMSVD